MGRTQKSVALGLMCVAVASCSQWSRPGASEDAWKTVAFKDCTPDRDEPLPELRGDVILVLDGQRTVAGVWIRWTPRTLERFILSAEHPFGGSLATIEWIQGVLTLIPPRELPSVFRDLPWPQFAKLVYGNEPCLGSQDGVTHVEARRDARGRLTGWRVHRSGRGAWTWEVERWAEREPIPQEWLIRGENAASGVSWTWRRQSLR